MLYVLHSGNMYGTERMALATISGMDEYARRVVFAPGSAQAGSVVAAALGAGFDCVSFHDRRSLFIALLPWFRRHRRVDLIGTGVTESYFGFLFAKLFGVDLRQLHVVHGGTEDWHAYGKKRKLNFIPVRLIAVSGFVRRKLVEFGVRPTAITVIDNFLTERQWRRSPRRVSYDSASPLARPIAPGRLKVAVVSRIEPLKRIHLLIDVVEQHGLMDVDFHVYGDGSELEALRARCAHLPNVHLHGYEAAVAERLTEADVFLHLCPVEPFGLAVLEAFAAKVVALVPDEGGAASLVEEGVTGWHFRSDDVADLAARLREIRAKGGVELQAVAEFAFDELKNRFSERRGLENYRASLLEASTF